MSGAAIRLIVAADEPAFFYSSISAAERKLEWIDVCHGVYPIAFDPEGNVYRLRQDGKHVFIELDSATPADLNGLNALLRKATGVMSSDNEYLVSLCASRVES